MKLICGLSVSGQDKGADNTGELCPVPWPAPKRSGVHLDLSTGDSNGPLTACGREPPALGCAQLLPVTVPQRVPCLRAACWQPGGRLGLQKYLLKSMTSYRSVSVCFFPL